MLRWWMKHQWINKEFKNLHELILMIDQFSCLFWNCKGTCNKSFFRTCNVYVKEKCPDILITMETRSDPEKLQKKIGRMGFNGFSST